MQLLCTLGTSWAVVPEAFLLGNGEDRYGRVLVLTTGGTGEPVAACRGWFEGCHPEVDLTILSIGDLDDLACASDHHRFEEALLRCYFSLLANGGGLHVCLAGGFKTMSSAAHQAADLLGCAKLFHVIAPIGKRFDRDDLIAKGIAEKEIRMIDLGSRSGWPTMRELAAESPPIPEESGVFAIADTRLRDKVYARLDAANHLMASEGDLATLPFPQIARWPPSHRDWLNQPLDPGTDAEWIGKLPKVELHCHLGGFATHGDLLEQVEAAAMYPDTLPPRMAPALPGNWPRPDSPCGLPEYMAYGDDGGSRLLKDPGCLGRHIELLYAHLSDQNISYAEIRCSPANYADTGRGRSPWMVLREIRGHFDRCREADGGKRGPKVNLIVIATRKKNGDYRSDISRHLALAVTGAEHWKGDAETRIVGVDLAGYENTDTRAHFFREEFTAIHRCGLALTIHAGENDDAEGIWSAVFDLNTRRIGHALHLIDSPDLLRSVAERGIGIEMCPYANYQIKGFAPMRGSGTYPLLDYLKAGVSVTVNTDNIGISGASLTDNFLLLPWLCPGIKRIHVLQLLRNAIDQAFLPVGAKHALLSGTHIPTPHGKF